jgi:hypothetical protein
MKIRLVEDQILEIKNHERKSPLNLPLTHPPTGRQRVLKGSFPACHKKTKIPKKEVNHDSRSIF